MLIRRFEETDRETLLISIRKQTEAMSRAGKNVLLARQSRLIQCEKRLAAQHPAAYLRAVQARSELLIQRLLAAMDRRQTALESRLTLLTDKLNALGPRQALNRGYSILLSGKTAVTSVEMAKENMTLLLRDGRIAVHATDIRKEDPFGEEATEL